jgi:hypothetical protein
MVLDLKMVLSAGFMHWPISLFGAVRAPWGPRSPRRVQKCLNQTICQVAPYLDLGAIDQFSTRIAVGHVPARRCVSKLAKLEYIARFQSKVGTVLIGRETMCGVILRGDEY